MPNDRSIFQPTLAEPAEVDIVKTVPTAPSALATALRGAAETAGLGVKKHLTDKAREEFSKEYESYLAKEEAEGLLGAVQQADQLKEQSEEFFVEDEVAPAQEAVLVEDMQNRIQKWDKAFKQKRIPAGEFKIKMESLLKKYISMAPGLAQDFRQAASGVLGFDPTGMELRAIEAQQRAAATDTDFIKKGLFAEMKKSGLYDTELSLERNIELYGDMAMQLNRRGQDLDMQIKVANNLNLMNERTESRFINTNVGLDLQASGTFVNDIAGRRDTENRADLLNAIESRRAELAAQYRSKYTHLDAGKIDAALKPINTLFDTAKDVVNGKQDKEVLDNLVSNNVQSIILDIQGTPQGARFIAATKTLKSLALPATVIQMLGEGSKAFKVPADMFGGTKDTSPFAVTKDMEDRSIADQVNTWFSNTARKMTTNIDTKDPEQVKQFQNIIEGVMVPMFSDPDEVKAIEYDTIFKMAGDPKFVEVLNAIPDNAKLKSKLARVSSQYTKALLQKMGTEAFENYDPERPSEFSLKEAFLGPDREKLVEIQVTDQGEFQFVPKKGLSGKHIQIADSIAKGYTRKYATRLNDAVKLTAHLKGHTKYKGMLDQLLDQAPELFPFLKEAKEAEPIEVE